jgi:hypothetical protein
MHRPYTRIPAGMHPQRDATRAVAWLFYQAKHPDGMQRRSISFFTGQGFAAAFINK